MTAVRAAIPAPPSTSLYTGTFWVAFVANVLLVTANTLTFRFAEFVKFLGGTEELTGRIVSIGLIGSLFWRVFLGQSIDTFGVRRVWFYSAAAFLAGVGLLLVSGQLGWEIYVARVVFAIGLASMFAASLSHIQNLAPASRRTEMIASFGASGFLGMIVGAQLGDGVFHWFPEGRERYLVLFGLTFAMGLAHAALAWIMTAGPPHSRPAEAPAVHRLLLRYWPPLVLIVTLMMGVGFAVTMIFLTRFATHLGLPGIRTFFTAYAVAAFLLRVLARNWSRTTGRHRLIVWGLAGHAVGQWLLRDVQSEWQFILPALCCGFGHALLFPCVVSLGAGAFPEQYRGTGTTITLAAVDMGTILSAPLLGWLIDGYGFQVMLDVVCAAFALSALLYGAMTWGVIDADTIGSRSQRSVAGGLRGNLASATTGACVALPASRAENGAEHSGAETAQSLPDGVHS